MFSDADQMLRRIGNDLGNQIYPEVVSGGIVMPSNNATPKQIVGVEQKHEFSRKERPPTRAWKRSQRWQRTTSRPRPSWTWSPDNTTPVISELHRNQYLAELDTVSRCYTNVQYWVQEHGLWLLFDSRLLPGYTRKAIFAVALPFYEGAIPRAWAFWSDLKWIGPRHTNFPDGSICAFEPSDLTWSIGDPILKLLDLYIFWAVKHLHLAFFDYWPGEQSAHHTYERLSELRDDELCGCGATPSKPYRDCCKERDYTVDRVAAAVNYVITFGGERFPPNVIAKFVSKEATPPDIVDVLNSDVFQRNIG